VPIKLQGSWLGYGPNDLANSELLPGRKGHWPKQQCFSIANTF